MAKSSGKIAYIRLQWTASRNVRMGHTEQSMSPTLLTTLALDKEGKVPKRYDP